MSIKNAWLGLTGKLPVVEVEKIVESTTKYDISGVANLCDVFVARRYGPRTYGYGRLVAESRYFATCELAHSECKGWEVERLDGLNIGGVIYSVSGLIEVSPEPKPKVSKGRRGR